MAQVKRIPKDLIQPGVPTAYPIYDSNGMLLFQAGTVIRSEEQLEKLMSRGLYLDQATGERVWAERNSGAGNYVSNDVKKEKEDPDAEIRVELPLKKLKPGESFQITPLADETGSTKYFVRFIGGLDKKGLICTIPAVDEKLIYVKENTGFEVKIFSGKDVYRFSTMVDLVANRPYPHMHLKYPREVYSKVLRKNQRIIVNVIASIANKTTLIDEDKKNAARFLDLSLGGGMAEAFKSIGQSGDELECSFKIQMDGGEVLFVIPGVLRSINRTRQPDGRTLVKHGIQFTEIPFQQKVLLQNYIFETLTGEKLEEL